MFISSSDVLAPGTHLFLFLLQPQPSILAHVAPQVDSAQTDLATLPLSPSPISSPGGAVFAPSAQHVTVPENVFGAHALTGVLIFLQRERYASPFPQSE